MMNREQIAAERGRMGQALGADASFGLLNSESVTANISGMQNAWTNLLTAVAGPNSQNVISVFDQTERDHGPENSTTNCTNRVIG